MCVPVTLTRRAALRGGLAGLGLAGLGAAGLTGCGGAPATAAIPEAGPAGPARRGGRMVIARPPASGAETLDPASSLSAYEYLGALYDRLVVLDDTGAAVPGLAESWESTPDARTWRFRLRRGVTFHHVRELTAADAVHTLRRILDPATSSPMAGVFAGLLGPAGLSAPDRYTLQVALTKPAAELPSLLSGYQCGVLPASGEIGVVTVCSTDDRYDNDVHYTGGAVLGIDMAGWSGTMLAFTARPPDPAVVGERWLPMWRERLEAAEPFLHHWLAHPERDDYWRHGSVCEDPSAIRAAVLAVGGWNDPYRDTVLRLLSTLDAPVRGIVGPWAHRYPDIELPPGPAIGFLQETLRWWDRWLKDEPTGVEDDPPLRAWIQEPVRPATTYPERPGRWVGCPVVGETTHELALGTGSEPVVVAAPDHTGIDAGRYFPFGNPTDLPPDQRAEDGRSVCFDLGPLPERVEILGRPVVRLRLDADRPAAAVVVRLCTVDDDGASTLVTRGVLNLTRRHGRDRTVPWTPGVPETVEVPLMATGSAVPAGGRLRVAVSQTYWPWVWPHPEPVRLTVVPDRSSLTLPLNTGTDLPAATFGPPEQAPPLPVTTTPPPDRPEREVLHDVGTGIWELRVDPRYGGSRTFPDGLSYAEDTRETYRITDGDPLSARAESAWTIAIGRGDWRTDVETRSVLTATATDFVADSSLVARHGGEVVAERRWHRTIPRRGA